MSKRRGIVWKGKERWDWRCGEFRDYHIVADLQVGFLRAPPGLEPFAKADVSHHPVSLRRDSGKRVSRPAWLAGRPIPAVERDEFGIALPIEGSWYGG
jgi:hypothetical protein